MSTEGVVIQRFPFGESSQVLVWCTPGAGRVHTMARGIQRRRSAFGGPVDLLDHCDLGYHARRPGELGRLVALRPRRRWRGLRESLPRLRAALVATDLVRSFLQPGEESVALHDAFVDCLATLEHTVRPGMVITWFRVRALSLAGLRPQLWHCVRCGGSPPGRRRERDVDLIGGGVLCPACVRGARGEERFPAPTLELLGQLAHLGGAAEALRHVPPQSTEQGRQLTRFLALYTAHALGHPLNSDGFPRRH